MRFRMGRNAGITAPGNDGVRFVLLLGLTSAALYGVAYLLARAFGNAAVARELPGGTRPYAEFLAYIAVFVALVALYGWLLIRTGGGQLQGRALRLALILPVLFHVCLLVGRPYLSTDLLSYVAHGHIASTGGNPYVDPVKSVAKTHFGHELASFGWEPVHGVSPYGPLWTTVEVLVLRVTHDVRTAMLLLKLVAVGASLISGWLIWVILAAVRPAAQVVGTVAYLWNPVVLSELAGEGHNDALMVVFVLASLALLVRKRASSSGVALMLGVLTKFVPLSLLPPYVVYMSRSRGRPLVRFALGLGVGLGAAALLYWPYWAGDHTFDGVRTAGETGEFWSTSGALWVVLKHLTSPSSAGLFTSLIVGGAFAAYVVSESRRVRDNEMLLEVSAKIALVYVLVASPHYWSWYVTMPIALIALVLSRSFVLLLLVTTLCSRLVAPFDDLVSSGFLSSTERLVATTAIGAWVPLAVFAARSRGMGSRLWSR